VAVVPTEPAEPSGAELRAAADRADRQRGMNALQVLLDDARHHPDGTVKLTQERIAELCGWRRGRVQYILRGAARTAPPLEDLEALAKALGLELEQVQFAASQVYGWNLYATRDERVAALVAKAGRLSDRDLQAVLALADHYLSAPPR
jgi:transcriptional regulator with XRE-family HTH domain